jgi:hypothetical protein
LCSSCQDKAQAFYDAYIAALDEKLAAAFESKLDAAITGKTRSEAIQEMKTPRFNESAKHIRVIKNTQYAFVQKDPDYMMSAEETAAWDEASERQNMQCTRR